MAKRKVSRKSEGQEQSSKYPKAVVQKSIQLLFVLKGHIKRAQQYFLVVARELAQIRDEEMYLPLNHPDMIDFVKAHLGLSQASMYRYLRVYDWVSKKHPEWLKPGWKGTIPDLAGMPVLIDVEQELERKDLDTAARRTLEAMHEKAVEGKLSSRELRSYRTHRDPVTNGLKSFLSTLRNDRRRGAQIANMPAEVISNLDEAIAALENAMDLHRATVAMGKGAKPAGWRGNLVT